jgi:bifunctional non-homologous end joining protein LigD
VASVSTPVTWDEVERGITSEQFTMDVVLARVARHGDLFAPALSGKVKLPV